MDISFVHTRKRKDFGKPCTFSDVGPFVITDVESNAERQKEFYILSSINREVDNSTKICCHEVNTDSLPTENRGMNHTEGGWPITVDIMDEESTTRFRKKIEKDKNYTNSVKSLGTFLENFVLENNSIDIYEEYFSGELEASEEEGPLKTFCVLSDPYKIPRKVVDVSWSLDASKVAGAYSVSGLDMSALDRNTNSYVWSIQNNVTPYCTLTPEFALNCVAFSPTELNLLLGGYNDGQVCIWDIRIGGHPQDISDLYKGHSQKVSGIKWLETASRMDFFSTSTDGKVMSWDARDLSHPTETKDFYSEKGDLKNVGDKFSISCSEYDPSVPNKFMLGTEQGKILSFNRRSEESTIYDTDNGPIISIKRNAFFPKLFASCNPWITQVWSEGSNISPILNIKSRNGYYTDIEWSPVKPSLLYITNTSGKVEIWDIPGKHTKPIADISIEKKALYSICINDPGAEIACGSSSGKIHILTAQDCFKTTNTDETDLIAKCIIIKEEISDGKSRQQRLVELRTKEVELNGIDLNETWDAPETADELRKDYESVLEKYPFSKKRIHHYQEF